MAEPVQHLFSYSFVVLMMCVLIFSGCSTEPERIQKVNFEEAEFSSFVESEFPFITTVLDTRNLGQGFPNDDIVSRCVALQLGPQAHACFDTDMLRWAVSWTGSFISLTTMAQISYNDLHNKANEIPRVLGTPKIATGLYPGWAGPSPTFTDPRQSSPKADSLSWGPISPEKGRWNGIHLQGEKVVLDYTVRGTSIHEMPGSVVVEEKIAFTRTIRAASPADTLTMTAAEVTNGKAGKINNQTATIYQGDDEGRVTKIGIIAEGEDVRLNITDDRYITVQIDPAEEEVQFTVVMWKGNADSADLFSQMLEQANTGMPSFKNGGAARWTETVHTQGQISPDTAAYVTDQLTLPIPNPWKRNVRIHDLAFFEGDSAAVVTFAGDVWIVRGIDEQLDDLQWQRFASGLYSPQSIQIVDNEIYVFGKDGITRFHDVNKDGEADFYENFSNLMAQSIVSRAWAGDMVKAPSGGFYIAKGGALDNGPQTVSPTVAKGFRAGSRHSGSVLKVSADGRSIETIATGLRGPYLGINSDTGILTGSDQEGNYVPATPILLIEEGDYFGVPPTAHRNPVPDPTEPLLWIPHSVDRSGMSQAWINSGKMGPLNDQLIHFSFGRPGLFKVLMDSTEQVVQGGITTIPAHYPAPTMKGAINPRDGQLYVAGFDLWGSDATKTSAFLRLRYTGKTDYSPHAFHVHKRGIVLRFDVPLDGETAENPAHYRLKRWNYKRTENYGSGHYKINGEAGEEMLPIISADLSKDKKAVFLGVPNMEEVMQMQLSYRLATQKGKSIEKEFWFTVKDLSDGIKRNDAFENLDLELIDQFVGEVENSAASDRPASAEQGEKLFQETGCTSCHATVGNAKSKMGPPLHGIFGTEQSLEEGSAVTVDEDYIRESIIHPSEKIVQGYENEMPSFEGILSDNEIESIILYIESL